MGYKLLGLLHCFEAENLPVFCQSICFVQRSWVIKSMFWCNRSAALVHGDMSEYVAAIRDNIATLTQKSKQTSALVVHVSERKLQHYLYSTYHNA